MKLYDIFYAGRSMDSSTRLTAKPGKALYAVNTNHDGHVYVPTKGGLTWRELGKNEAIRDNRVVAA